MPNTHKKPIFSQQKTELWGSWIGAIVFSLLSITLLIALLPEVTRYDFADMTQEAWMKAGFAFGFPCLSLLAIGMAVVKTQQWLRYGKTPVVLDPNPASIGGDIGGYVDIKTRLLPSHQYSVAVQAIKITVRRSGDSTTTHRDVQWSCQLPNDVMAIAGETRIRFLQTIPDDLPSSEAKDIVWELAITAGPNTPRFERTWNIPVHTGIRQAKLSLSASAEQKHKQEQFATAIKTAGLKQKGDALLMYFKPLQRQKMVFPLLLNGIIFTVVGSMTLAADAPAWIAVFAAVGIALLGSGLYVQGRSRSGVIDPAGLRSELRCFGLPLRSINIAKDDIKTLTTKAGSVVQVGTTTTQFYQVVVSTHSGKTRCISLGVEGKDNAEMIARVIAKRTGLAYAECE